MAAQISKKAALPLAEKILVFVFYDFPVFRNVLQLKTIILKCIISQMDAGFFDTEARITYVHIFLTPQPHHATCCVVRLRAPVLTSR